MKRKNAIVAMVVVLLASIAGTCYFLFAPLLLWQTVYIKVVENNDFYRKISGLQRMKTGKKGNPDLLGKNGAGSRWEVI